MNTVQLFDYKILAVNLKSIEFSKNKTLINTINPHSYRVAKNDDEFKQALQHSDILLADGIGIVMAIKWLKKQVIKKIAGSDIHRYLLQKANSGKLKVFYLGASQKTLDIIRNKINIEYPNIIVESYSPPFKRKFSDDDTQLMIDKVNSFEPDILFVGMTAPKQEKWVYINKNHLNANIICSIGAVFDFYAETVKRPPQWVIKIGFEWLGRLLKEPKRMWQRNFISTPVFIFDVVKEKYKLVVKKH